MSIQHANRGIVKKDLQLYYNREYNGSFLGEATMNFFSIPTAVDAWGSHTSVRTSTSSGVPDLIVSGNKQVYYTPEYYTLTATSAWQAEVNRWLVYPKQGSGANSYVPNGAYNFSFYARSLSGNTVLQYSFYGITPRSTATLTTKWQRFNGTFTINNGPLTLLEFGNLNAGTMVCQIACIQVEAKSYATPFTLPALWSPNLVNVTSTSGHTIMTKNTSGDSWVNARVYSSEGYTEPCHVSFKASQTNLALMISLNTNPVLKGVQYSTLDYAWHPTTNGLAYIYESGTDRGSQGSYTTSTIFQIIYDGVNINYYMDGVLKRSVARSGSGPLYLDSSFYSNSSIVNSLSFGPLLQINRFSNYTIGGGGLLDISGNNVNADLSNISFNATGFYFNGSSNSIYLGTELNLQNGTISAWVNPAISSATTYHGIIGKTSGGGGGQQTWYIDWISGNALRGGIGNSVGADVVTQTWNPTAGTWYFITFVFDSSYLYLYINGVQFVTPLVRTRECQNSAHPVYIGRVFEQAVYAWNGQIGQVTINRTALTAAEVLQNFNATRKTYGI
jgi:hypothetical protein